jgi:O-antigen/teichoic acid export membrane protein
MIKGNHLNIYSPHFFTGIAFAFFGATRFGFNLLVQWVMGSETVGHYNLVLSSALMISLFLLQLFGVSISKFASEAKGKGDEAEFYFVVGFNFWLMILIASLTAGCYYLLIPKIAAQFETSTTLFYWSPAIILLTCANLFFRRLYFVVEKIKFYSVLEITAAFIFFACLYVCLMNEYRDWLLLPFIIQMGVFCSISIIVFFKQVMHLRWLKDLSLYKNRLPFIFKYSAITGIGSALTSISMHIFTLVLGGVADITGVGHFSLVRSTVEPSTFLFRIINMVQFPKIANIYGKGDFQALRLYMQNSIRRLGKIISLGFIPFILATPYLARFLFGPNRVLGQTMLLGLMLTTFYLRTLSVCHINFLNATRYPHIPNFFGPLAIFIAIPFISPVYNLYGLGGLGVLILSAEIIRFTIVTIVGKNKMAGMEEDFSRGEEIP